MHDMQFIKKTRLPILLVLFASADYVISNIDQIMFHINNCIMKKLMIQRAALVVFAVLLVAPMVAFTLRGGEGFEIYLGKNLVVQQFLPKDKDIKTIDFSNVATTEELRVSYSHCGQSAGNRVVSIKDKTVVLKEWKFADAKAGASAKMIIPVKEIAAIQKNQKGKQLSLFYSSSLLKEGHVLATLTSGATQASLK